MKFNRNKIIDQIRAAGIEAAADVKPMLQKYAPDGKIKFFYVPSRDNTITGGRSVPQST